jgi:predicted enzyme related to lactoylglutathione lyase
MGLPVVHFEIHGEDSKAISTFYSAVFEWSINADNPLNYGLVDTDAEGRGIGGGICASDMAPAVLIYIQVDDPQAYLDKVEAAGGRLSCRHRDSGASRWRSSKTRRQPDRPAGIARRNRRGPFMQLGVVFPQLDIGADPVAVRDYAQAAEALGYTHILAFDHVIGVNPASRPGWTGPYDHKSTFHEPLVLFGFLAGVTRKLAHQWRAGAAAQTQLVATGGRGRRALQQRLRPASASAAEFEAMGGNTNRGRRIEEQIAAA